MEEDNSLVCEITKITLTYNPSLEHVTEVMGTHASPIMGDNRVFWPLSLCMRRAEVCDREYDTLLSVCFYFYFYFCNVLILIFFFQIHKISLRLTLLSSVCLNFLLSFFIW